MKLNKKFRDKKFSENRHANVIIDLVYSQYFMSLKLNIFSYCVLICNLMSRGETQFYFQVLCSHRKEDSFFTLHLLLQEMLSIFPQLKSFH